MHARGFVGSGRGGTDEKESRRKASTRTEEEYIKSEKKVGTKGGEMAGDEGERLDGVKKDEVHGRNALRGEREGRR